MSYATSSTAQRSNASACAACKVQRRKCSEKCLLAPYFPPDDIRKFLLIRRVFGNRRVLKLLKDLPADKRDDAVSSIVYEARERVRDPVFGCAGVVTDLKNKVLELQSQLVSAQAEVATITQQNANLLTVIYGYHEVSEPNFYIPSLEENEDTGMNINKETLQLWEPP